MVGPLLERRRRLLGSQLVGLSCLLARDYSVDSVAKVVESVSVFL